LTHVLRYMNHKQNRQVIFRAEMKIISIYWYPVVVLFVDS